MNKEGILREINNDVVNTSYYPARSDCCDLDGEIFEDVVLDNIKCHRMTFQNCTFRNVQFIDNQVDLIEFENCQFINTVFKGTLENLYLIISDSSFSKCTMHDLKISGYEEQSEITDCTFEECTFSDINLLADLTLQGGTVTNCTGNNLECIMNMIFAVQFTKSKFENINLNVAIIKNTFQHNLPLQESPESFYKFHTPSLQMADALSAFRLPGALPRICIFHKMVFPFR